MPAAADDPPEAWVRRRLATLAQKRAAEESGIHTRVLRMTTPGEAQYARQKLAQLRAGPTTLPVRPSHAAPGTTGFDETYGAKLLLSRLPLHEEPDAPDPDPILPLGREATAKRVALYKMSERTKVRLGDLELRDRELSAADADGEGACLFASLLCAAARPEPARRVEASHGRVQADVRHTLAESAAARAAAAKVLSHTELAASRLLYDDEAVVSGSESAVPAAAPEEAAQQQVARAGEAEPPASPARVLRRAAQAQVQRATEAQHAAQAKAAAARAASYEAQAKASAASLEAQEAKHASDAATIWAARATTDDAAAARAAAKAAATWAAEAAKAQAAAAQEAASARAQADAEVRAATQEAEEAAHVAQAAQAQVDAEDAAAWAKAEAEAEAAASAAAEAATRHGAAAQVQARVRARRASEEAAARAEVIDHRELLQRSAALRSWAAAAGLAADDDDQGRGRAAEYQAAVGGGAAPEGASEPGASTAQSEAELLGLSVPLLQQPAEAAASSREALPNVALLASQQLALSRQLCELAAGLGSSDDGSLGR